MLKNMNVEKKSNFYKVIFVAFIISIILGFILPYLFLLQIRNSSELNSAVSLSNIAGYFRFLSGDRNQIVINIAIHNIATALFAFILSFFTFGIVGCFFLFANSFVLSTTLFEVHTLSAIIFIFLEFLGMCLATFGGANLAVRRKDGLNFAKISKYTSVLILSITIIYLVAAFIESNVILNQW